MHSDSRLGRRLAPLVSWLEKATKRVEPSSEQVTAMLAKMPSFSHEGVDYDTKALEGRLTALGSDEAKRKHFKDNPTGLLTAYDKARRNAMRSTTMVRKTAPITERMSDEDVRIHAASWHEFSEGVDDIGEVTSKQPYNPQGNDPYKLIPGKPLQRGNVAAVRNRALRDAKHNPVLSGDQLKQISQGVENLRLQGHLDHGKENHLRVFNAFHGMRMERNPKAMTSVGGLPEAMLPIFQEAAKTLGPDGSALHDMFGHAQKVFQDHPLPFKDKKRPNIGRIGYSPLAVTVESVERERRLAKLKDKKRVENNAEEYDQRQAQAEAKIKAPTTDYAQLHAKLESGEVSYSGLTKEDLSGYERWRRQSGNRGNVNKSMALRHLHDFITTLRKA